MVSYQVDCTYQVAHEPLLLLAWGEQIVGNQEGIVPQEKQDELELAGIPFEAGIQIVAVLTYRQKERHLVATFVG